MNIRLGAAADIEFLTFCITFSPETEVDILKYRGDPSRREREDCLEEPFNTMAKRSLGQNFLVSGGVAAKIVDAVSPLPGELVFEIGPGTGALTEPLAGSGAAIVAYEIDGTLVELLSEKFEDLEKVNVVHADIRGIDFEGEAGRLGFKGYKVVGNIPYHLTANILTALPRWKGCAAAVVMVQKEVGERIQAGPGQRDCGILSVFLQSYFDIERVMRVKPGSFRPRPKVESVVLKLVPRAGGEGPADREGFFLFVKKAFSQRRKKLKTVLRGLAGAGDGSEIIVRVGIDPDARPEELRLDDWHRLFAAFSPGEGKG